MNAPTVYLAARAGRQAEIRGYAQELAGLGWDVTSRWLWREGARADETRMTDRDRGVLAYECREDVWRSAILIAFTEEPDNPYGRGGRHVELGIAIDQDDMRVIVCGPRENVFCCLPDVEVYPSWADVVRRLGPPPVVAPVHPGGASAPLPGCKHHRVADANCTDCHALLDHIEEQWEGSEA